MYKGQFQHFAIAIRVLAVENEFADTVQQAGDEEMFALMQAQPLGQCSCGKAGQDAMLQN